MARRLSPEGDTPVAQGREPWVSMKHHPRAPTRGGILDCHLHPFGIEAGAAPDGLNLGIVLMTHGSRAWATRMPARGAFKSRQGWWKAGARSSSGFLFRKPTTLLLPEKHPIRVALPACCSYPLSERGPPTAQRKEPSRPAW
jgi:hypothetical protein